MELVRHIRRQLRPRQGQLGVRSPDREPIRHALHIGTIPIISAMAVAGVVSRPGVMTGQMLTSPPGRSLHSLRTRSIIRATLRMLGASWWTSGHTWEMIASVCRSAVV